MSGTDDLISKWTAQMAELKAKAEATPPGADRDALRHRIALCQRAIDMTETLLAVRQQTTSLAEANPADQLIR